MRAEYLFHHPALPHISIGPATIEAGVRHLLAAVRHALCGLRGHDVLLHREPRRLSLRCADCGWQSSGLTLDRPHYVRIDFDRPEAVRKTGSVITHLAEHRPRRVA